MLEEFYYRSVAENVGEDVAHIGEKRGAYRVLWGKPEGKRPRGRPRHRWEDNIKMNHQEMEWGAWTGLIWVRVGTGGRLL